MCRLVAHPFLGWGILSRFSFRRSVPHGLALHFVGGRRLPLQQHTPENVFPAKGTVEKVIHSDIQ